MKIFRRTTFIQIAGKDRWRSGIGVGHLQASRGRDGERVRHEQRIGRTDKIDVDEDKIKQYTDAVEANNEKSVKVKDADIEEDDVVRWPPSNDDNKVLARRLNNLEENGDIRLSIRVFSLCICMGPER